MKTLFKRLALVLSVMCIIAFASPICLYATSLDDISQTKGSSNESNPSSSNGNAVSDYLQGYTPITEENMEQANQLAGPVATAIGTITGFVIIIVSAGIFFVTALDLVYIGIPFTRSYLNAGYGAAAQGGGMSPMGGMGMGMGMRGMGMAGGMPQGSQPVHTKCFVSDEAVACVNMVMAQQAPQGGMMGGGMSPMGGMMGGMPAQQPQVNTKSVILQYLKKRAVFLVIFAICTVILMSSIFTDCGINLAALLNKVLTRLNGAIGNVNV